MNKHPNKSHKELKNTGKNGEKRINRYLIKEKDLFKELYQTLIEMEMNATLLRSSLNYCSNFMKKVNILNLARTG